MTKLEFRLNIIQACRLLDTALSEKDLQFVVGMLYTPKTSWYFEDFYNFAESVRRYDGNVIDVLNEYGMPDLLCYDMEVKDWFASNKKLIKEVLSYVNLDNTRNELILFVDIDILVEWLKEHENHYRDCILYVQSQLTKANKPD